MSTDGAFAKAPWQLRWKRPQLDDVVVGISGEGDDVDIDSDNDDTNIRIGEGWVPISSSSAALTRNEARMVILELQRRDKLLVGRKGKIDELQEQIRGDPNLQSEPVETHADHSDPSSKPTPKNKNTKVITTDFSDDIAPPPPKLPLRTPESPVKSLISPSTWFKSITSPTPARNLDGRPPRSSSSNSNLKTPKSTSPTSFSTFMIRTPPPDDSPDHEFEDSPPQIMDTSTASSLLWEDMTLTSVTEEDAAAFRMYEKGKRNRAMSHGVEIDEDGAYIDGIRLNELDGFDHVILSVTIFSKKPTTFKSGEVVTMELLSTKNPPMIRSKVSSFGSLKEKQQHSKKVSISSSSSSPQTASKESSNVSAPDDEKRSEDRTRLLARRVLWWPATFQKQTEGSDRGCPSFVSLGRTSVYRGTKKIDETPKPSQTADLNLANLERDDKEGIPRRKESQSPPVSPKEIDAARTNNERTADALDALRSLNFLLGGEVSTASSAKFVEAKSSMDPNRRAIQPLSMCLVANDGCVYSYNPLRVLLNFKSEFQSGKELGDSFASILFGRGLHRKINEQIVPLSRPRRILQLSQIDRNCCVEEGGETFPGSHENGPVKREREKHWDYLSSFDASIDPSSLHLRTERRTNTIIGSCITSNVSNAFLAVCGKGLRRRSKDLLESGGYVTFISLKNGAEVRTLFLPLEPTSIHTAYWTGMHFVMIMGRHDRSGKPYALAIRVDHGVPSADFSRDIQDAMQRTRRFQAFPIKLHDCMEPSRIIGMSSVPSSPPGILVSCGYQLAGKGHRSKLVVTNNTLALRTTKGGVFEISSSVCSGHTAFLDDEGKAGISDIWCIGGQGWSLIGLRGKPSCYFVCWEGARDEVEGPHVIGLQQEGPWDRLPAVASASFDQVALSDSFGVSQPIAKSFFSQTLNGLPNFSAGYSPSKTFSLSFEDSVRMTVAIDGQLDIVLSNALDSITPDHNASPDTRATINNSRRKKLLSLKDKSNRLLKQCDSWIQLEDTKANRVLVDGQVIVANIRFGPRLQSLTMRTNTIANPITTPFNQILSWLCQRRDYSTAASVALSLLGDAESVYQLCGIPIDPDENFTRHEGLLDGITPIDGIPDEAFSATLASLADMAVGCLIKGGVSMSQSLEGFLSRNTQYNASRACLMLVGSVAIALSRYSPPPQQTSNVNIVRLCEESERLPTEVTWPVSSLMKMSVVRNCLPETLLLLNATISNELRWRAPRSRGLATEARPSLGLFLSLVEIILESADESTRLLLDMVDDETGKVYWWSIEDDAKLALCMVSIRGRHVMLLEPEVRAWLLVQMKREIDSTAEARHIEADPELSSELLKEVISGVFGNAGCDLVIKLETYLNETSESPTCYRQSMDVLKGLLGPSNGMLDFDTLIAGLLLLIRRGRSWGHSTGVSTQTLLNAVCDLAGRRTSDEPIFVFDSATVMRQCALCNNVQAAAFLVGGKNGLVLECSDLLLASLQSMDMKTAENALLSGSLTDLQTIAGQAMGQQSQFSLSSCHEHILWLLETYVLSASTYGEFETSPSALGKDPVFTGRVCFRAWYCLTSGTPDSTRWLESWLRDGLRLHGGVSPKRLACAALIRSLIWADELDLDGDGESDLLLATLIGFGNSFLAELAQTCCGLIESVPSNLAEEICSSSTEPLFVLNQVETLTD